MEVAKQQIPGRRAQDEVLQGSVGNGSKGESFEEDDGEADQNMSK